jgi:short-subunit dehydrogenase
VTAQPVVGVVTGASSGIGRATAHLLAGRGAHLTLIARGRGPLEETAIECRAAGAASVHVMTVDVGDSEALEAAIREIQSTHGRIDVAVQSAGVVAYGPFVDIPAEVFDGVLRVNVLGSANLARSVLPGMRERGRGSFVLIGSVIGAIAVPQMSPYVVSKWAIRSLARELQLENRDCRGVNVTCVTPGSVDTPIYLQAANYDGHVGRPPPPVVSPERAARAVIRAIDRPRRTVDVGAANKVMRAGFTLLPRVFDALVGPLFSVTGRDQARATPGPGNVFESQAALNRVHGEQGSSVVATARAVGAKAGKPPRRDDEPT